MNFEHDYAHKIYHFLVKQNEYQNSPKKNNIIVIVIYDQSSSTHKTYKIDPIEKSREEKKHFYNCLSPLYGMYCCCWIWWWRRCFYYKTEIRQFKTVELCCVTHWLSSNEFLSKSDSTWGLFACTKKEPSTNRFESNNKNHLYLKFKCFVMSFMWETEKPR